MIVRPLGDGRVQIVRQVDHDDLSGEIAARWGASGCWAPEPRAAVLRACAEHDDGWWDAERAPALDPQTGRPQQFTAIDTADHVALYRAGIRRVTERDPYAGLLVSMHGAGLYTGRYGAQPALIERLDGDRARIAREFLDEQEALQDRLRGDLDASEEQLWPAYRLLQATDLLSLCFCMEPRPLDVHPVAPGEAGLHVEPAGEGRASVAPFPLATDPARLKLTRRVLHDRAWPDEETFRGAFFAAQPETVEVELVGAR